MNYTKVNTHSLITALKALKPIAPKNDCRYYLNGIHLYNVDDSIILEATNGHILGRVELDSEYSIDIDVILPHDCISDLVKIKVPANKRKIDRIEITVDVEAYTVSFCHGMLQYSYRYIEGTYPDTDRILKPRESKEYDDTRGFNGKYLATIFKSASMLADPKYHGIAIKGSLSATCPMYLEVPTNHGAFVGITKPAKFLVCTTRL